MSNHELRPLTEAELDCLILRHKPTQALLDHLERKNRIPRVGRYFIPTRAPWWVRVYNWIRSKV